MIRLNRRNAQVIYTAIQVLFWVTFGLMFSFASAYLQVKGFSNRGIGLILGCSYAASAVLQPALAAVIQRTRIRPEKGLCGLYAVSALLSLLLLLLPLSGPVLGVVIIAVFSLYSSLQPLVNSLPRRWSDAGCPVEYGAARSVASLSFAGMTAGTGWLLQKIHPSLLPGFYLATLCVSILLLALLTPPEDPEILRQDERARSQNRLAAPTGFSLLLIGVGCLSLAHVLIDNFMLQIMQDLGGNSQNLGVAAAIASLVEVPGLWLYGRISKRVEDRKLLAFSAWAWALKNFLIFLAGSPLMIYGAEVLQFCAYGFYTPSSVRCVDQWFPPESRLQGQSMIGSAYTVGCVLAALLGGNLLDVVGVSRTLLTIVAVSLAGAVLVTISVRTRKQTAVKT